MVTSFLRAIPGWIMYHISDFLTLLRSRTLSPPRREFIHLINPAPTKPGVNGKRINRPR